MPTPNLLLTVPVLLLTALDLPLLISVLLPGALDLPLLISVLLPGALDLPLLISVRLPGALDLPLLVPVLLRRPGLPLLVPLLLLCTLGLPGLLFMVLLRWLLVLLRGSLSIDNSTRPKHRKKKKCRTGKSDSFHVAYSRVFETIHALQAGL